MSRRSRGCGAPIRASSTAETLDRAIGHVVELQRSDGSFGVWSDTDDTVPWLDAYATDFLIRAKEHGKNVPDYAINAARRLAARLCPPGAHRRSTTCRRWPMPIMCWRAPNPTTSPALRYFNDTQLARLPTQLAKAQVAAALAHYGDAARAAAAYDAALGAGAAAAARRSAMSTTAASLRDSAAVLAFAAANPGDRSRG